MTAPQDPFSTPNEGDGVPGQPAGYGTPSYGQPAYGSAPGYGAPAQATGTNGLAIASLVTAFLCSPLGVILGFVAKGQIKKTGQGGNGLATAGIVIGVVSILLGIAFGVTGALNTSP